MSIAFIIVYDTKCIFGISFSLYSMCFLGFSEMKLIMQLGLPCSLGHVGPTNRDHFMYAVEDRGTCYFGYLKYIYTGEAFGF